MLNHISEYIQDLEKETLKTYVIIKNQDILPKDLIDLINTSNTHTILRSAEGMYSSVEDRHNINDWGKNNDAFPFHVDGGYYETVPQYVILHCKRPGPTGGNSLLASAEEIIKKLEYKYDSNFLNAISIVWISSKKYKFKRPLIQEVDGGRQLNWFSSLYLEPDAQMISPENRRFLTAHMTELMNDMQKFLLECIILNQQWQANDLLLFNNQLLLHGRDKIPENGDRLLHRIWIQQKGKDMLQTPL